MKTAKQILKALTLHNDLHADCDECPYRNETRKYSPCWDVLYDDVATLAVEAVENENIFLVGDDLKARGLKLAAEVLAREGVTAVNISINSTSAIVEWIENGIDCTSRLFDNKKE